MAKTNEVNSLGIHLKENQKEVIRFLAQNEISILTGMEGTAKSTLVVYYGLKRLADKEFDRIVITKPLQTTGQEIGFLPGELEAKTDPFILSYIEIFEKLVGAGKTKDLFTQKKVVFLPLPFVRGRTCERSLMILDEAQNANLHTIMSFVTRGSEDSKVVVLGDPFQSDIKQSGLSPFIGMTYDIEGVAHMELDETFQMRKKILVDLRKAYIKHLNAKS